MPEDIIDFRDQICLASVKFYQTQAHGCILTGDCLYTAGFACACISVQKHIVSSLPAEERKRVVFKPLFL